MAPVLTEAKAQACLPLVQKFIDTIIGAGWEPKLYPPDFHDKHWTVALECEADNWPYYFGEAVYRGEITLPSGVDTGAINHWCMTVRPKTNPDCNCGRRSCIICGGDEDM